MAWEQFTLNYKYYKIRILSVVSVCLFSFSLPLSPSIDYLANEAENLTSLFFVFSRLSPKWFVR